MSVTWPWTRGLGTGVSFYRGVTINQRQDALMSTTPQHALRGATAGGRSRSRLMVDPPGLEFHPARPTWVAYVVLAWFAYLQAAPGLVIAHLRDELHLSYSTGGLHVAAFATGSLVAGLVSGRIEGAIGRRALFWSAAALMA